MVVVCWICPVWVEPRYTPYPATAVLSVDADHVTVTLEALADVTRKLPGDEGAVVSPVGGGGGGVVGSVVFATDAVAVLLAMTVPVSLTA